MATPRLVATSALSSDQRSAISSLVARESWFEFYWRCSLEDLDSGRDNRSYLLGRRGRGLVLGVHFHEISIFSTVGELDADELDTTLARPERLELHVRAGEMESVRAGCGARLRRVDRLRYYRLECAPRTGPTSCRPIGGPEAAEVLDFFREHYDETIISPWMLEELPFVGIWEDGLLVATAGTIVLSDALRACHVGHFLTHPARRGRGLARTAANGLIQLLGRRGVTTFMLGVDETNKAAQRVYESVGFVHIATRENVFVDATRSTQDKRP